MFKSKTKIKMELLEEKNNLLLQKIKNQEELIKAQNKLITELNNQITSLQITVERDKEYAKDAINREYEVVKSYEEMSKNIKEFMEQLLTLLKD